MGADNWALCPRCAKQRLDTAREILSAAEKARDEAYGKVDQQEFIRLDRAVTDAEAAKQALLDDHDRTEFRTLRENYEVGVFDSELFISYSGGCQTCGLAVKFQHEEPVS
jgi:hypothetical protein